jgi:AcrR family transcriptional regulator
MTRRRREDSVRNEAQVLSAARETLDERGLAADVREIARRAGVGVATVYRHFPTKDDLVQAALRTDLDGWTEVTARAVEDPDAWTGLRTIVEHTVRAMSRHRAILDGLASQAEAFAACHAHLRDALSGVVARAHEQGTLRRDASAGDVGLQILALSGVAQLAADEETLFRHAGLMLDGLRARA